MTRIMVKGFGEIEINKSDLQVIPRTTTVFHSTFPLPRRTYLMASMVGRYKDRYSEELKNGSMLYAVVETGKKGEASQQVFAIHDKWDIGSFSHAISGGSKIYLALGSRIYD